MTEDSVIDCGDGQSKWMDPRRRLPIIGLIMKTIRSALLLNLGVAGMATSIFGAELAPDFSLEDLNPQSVRHGQMVSPHDYRLQVSAYYFGSAG